MPIASTPLIANPDFSRAWFHDLTVADLCPPRDHEDAFERASWFRRVVTTEALDALAAQAGRRLETSRGADTVWIELDSHADLVAGQLTLTSADGPRIYELRQLRLRALDGHLLPHRSDPEMPYTDAEPILTKLYIETLGTTLDALIQDAAEMARHLQMAGIWLNPATLPADRRGASEGDINEFNHFACRVAVQLFTTPGQDLNEVACAVLGSWKAGAPDLLAAAADILSTSP
ncbi:hypothetical protein ABIE44_003008 [Marmoricola sp. OAE513]|uniref:hypothetical protein n=1 Tax=Marmoricola sp. OAE513 TaxID=2817894 RepID=UPI001AE90373